MIPPPKSDVNLVPAGSPRSAEESEQAHCKWKRNRKASHPFQVFPGAGTIVLWGNLLGWEAGSEVLGEGQQRPVAPYIIVGDPALVTVAEQRLEHG